MSWLRRLLGPEPKRDVEEKREVVRQRLRFMDHSARAGRALHESDVLVEEIKKVELIVVRR